MAAYRGLPPLVVAQGDDDGQLSISVSDANANHHHHHNRNHDISSSHVFARHVVPPCKASGFFLDAVPPGDQTTRSYPWLHDLAYYYIENLNYPRHFRRIFTRLDFIDLLASFTLLQTPSRRPPAILTSTSTSTDTSTSTCTNNTNMLAPKLLKAFQDEFDRQERCAGWPREYTDAILHLRKPRERGAREARECLMKTRSEGRIQVEEASFSRAAPRNGIIKVTTVYPSGSSDPKRPCIVFCHGGAMAGSDRYVGLHVNGPIWAEALGAVTVSVEYGRAPENHGVGLARDCYEALVWCWENVEFDHERLLLYGASAGGALAAGAALTLIHEQKTKTGLPKLCGLFLEAPMLDWRCDTDSMRRLSKDGPFFNREACVFAWQSVIQGKQVEFSEFVSPAEARKNDMAMLPPTAAYVGDMDPLLDEVICFMEKPGRPDFTYRVFQGVPHGFDAILPAEPISVQAKDWRLQWIKTRFRIG
ncbi:alpha/beta hydrolase fold-3 domain-containing protein [Apiospora arundinis]|uniref:Alpha/beta hydrolase fold-3 domain-containing protein n=1 Tax=Apiospora arundinis TaxID=335852 RepID=A0ABR2J7N9_9PEZI